MKKYWEQIEAWFKEHHPEILETFNPPATEADFESLETVLGFSLPKDFREFYAIHNGQDTGLVFRSAIIEPESEGLSPIEKIINVHFMYQEISEYGTPVTEEDVEKGIKPLYWSTQWIPIMEDGTGNSYFLDMDPADGGKVGQVIFRHYEGPTYELIAPSFRNWVKQFVEGNLD